MGRSWIKTRLPTNYVIDLIERSLRRYYGTSGRVESKPSSNYYGYYFVGWTDKEGIFHTCHNWFWVLLESVAEVVDSDSCGCQDGYRRAILKDLKLRDREYGGS